MTALPVLFPTPPSIPDIEPDMRVGFILSPNFTLLPFAGFIDSLRHAADEGDFSRQVHCQWEILGPTTEPVAASCGVRVMPNKIFRQAPTFDFIVVIGGLLPSSFALPEETLDYIRRAYEADTAVIGLCTGSFILARAGLLDNRRCAVHVAHRDLLKKLFPRTLPETDQVYINDGEIITCPGGTAALDLAVSLIEEYCGRARAIKAMRALLVDKHRTTNNLPNHPFGRLMTCGNRQVEQAMALMKQRISTPFKLHELAQKLNTSQRELNRVFKRHAGSPPSAVWRKMRLSHAHWLLANTTRTVTQIAQECGFADSAHFCRWFRRTYNESPVEFRKRRREV